MTIQGRQLREYIHRLLEIRMSRTTTLERAEVRTLQKPNITVLAADY
jgi:hypothetical protein